jgi:hypothetical protein
MYDPINEEEMDEVAIYFDDNELIVAYGDSHSISIELNTEEERETVRTVLSDVNFWTAFLGALGQAMEQVKINNKEQVVEG